LVRTPCPPTVPPHTPTTTRYTPQNPPKAKGLNTWSGSRRCIAGSSRAPPSALFAPRAPGARSSSPERIRTRTPPPWPVARVGGCYWNWNSSPGLGGAGWLLGLGGGGANQAAAPRLEVARWKPSRRTAPEDRAHRVLFPLRGVVEQQALHLQRISEARGHQSSNPNRLICTMVNSFYSIDWQNLGLFLTWLFLCVW
jgi:hypothetical protein